MAYFKQKQYSLAAEPLQKAVAIEPEYQPGHCYLGLTLRPAWQQAGIDKRTL